MLDIYTNEAWHHLYEAEVVLANESLVVAELLNPTTTFSLSNLSIPLLPQIISLLHDLIHLLSVEGIDLVKLTIKLLKEHKIFFSPFFNILEEHGLVKH